jgi:hypothetical protein
MNKPGKILISTALSLMSLLIIFPNPLPADELPARPRLVL